VLVQCVRIAQLLALGRAQYCWTAIWSENQRSLVFILRSVSAEYRRWCRRRLVSQAKAGK